MRAKPAVTVLASQIKPHRRRFRSWNFGPILATAWPKAGAYGARRPEAALTFGSNQAKAMIRLRHGID